MKELEDLATIRLGRRFLWLDEVDSTNNYIKERMERLPDGFAVAAGYQSGGRGTRSRGWAARTDSSLMFSFLLRDISPEQLPCLPLLAGLAVCEAVMAAAGCCAGVKWPNDVVSGGGKLCGILCESRRAEQSASAVVGIGVNLTQTAGEFEALNLVYAASLLMVSGREIKPLALASEILNRIEPMLDEYRLAGFSDALRNRYKSVSLTVGREVRFLKNGGEAIALVRDIARDGSLIVLREGREERIYAGDISVRGLYGYVD